LSNAVSLPIDRGSFFPVVLVGRRVRQGLLLLRGRARVFPRASIARVSFGRRSRPSPPPGTSDVSLTADYPHRGESFVFPFSGQPCACFSTIGPSASPPRAGFFSRRRRAFFFFGAIRSSPPPGSVFFRSGLCSRTRSFCRSSPPRTSRISRAGRSCQQRGKLSSYRRPDVDTLFFPTSFNADDPLGRCSLLALFLTPRVSFPSRGILR